MSSACELCGGACCESLALSCCGDEDIRRLLELRGTPRADGLVMIEAPCRALKDGMCMIYPDRPKVCRDYQVGSVHCRETVALRRPDLSEKILAVLDGGGDA